MVWNGDIDLGDGACEKLHQEYLDNLANVEKLDSNIFEDIARQVTLQLLLKRHNLLKSDLQFIYDGKSSNVHCMMI